MYKDRLITAVIPAHNEGRHIGQAIKTIPSFIDNIIVVDDCVTITHQFQHKPLMTRE